MRVPRFAIQISALSNHRQIHGKFARDSKTEKPQWQQLGTVEIGHVPWFLVPQPLPMLFPSPYPLRAPHLANLELRLHFFAAFVFSFFYTILYLNNFHTDRHGRKNIQAMAKQIQFKWCIAAEENAPYQKMCYSILTTTNGIHVLTIQSILQF